MMSNHNSQSSTQKGFTLIELLVVIAIIGILASIVLASLDSARTKSRDARRVADLRSIQQGLELYYNTYNKFPITLSALATSGVMPSVPTDPSTKANYDYAAIYSVGGSSVCATGVTGFHLGADLEQSNNSSLSSAAQAANANRTCNGSNPDFTGSITAPCIPASETGYCYDLHS